MPTLALMIAVSTDSCADLSPAELARSQIFAVSMSIEHSGEVLLDGSLTPAELIDRVSRSGQAALSLNPSVAEYARHFHQLLSRNDEVIHLSSSAAISDDFRNARTAAQAMRGRVHVVDTGMSSYAMGVMAQRAAELIVTEKNATPNILRALEDLSGRINLYLAVPNLEFLRLNRRLSGTAAFIGGLMRVTPVLTFRQGVIDTVSRPRGSEQAERELEALMGGEARGGPLRLHYLHTTGGELPAAALRSRTQQMATSDTGLHPVGTVLSANLGAGVFGVVTERI